MERIRLNRGVIYCIIIATFLAFFLIPAHLRGQGNKVIHNEKYSNIISTYARRHKIPSSLIKSIIYVESNFNYRAISPKGAMGLMQLMPDTAKKYGVKDIYNPRENIEGGVRYLRDLVKTYKASTNLVLAAYNAGPEAVKKHRGIPPYPETINFIRKVRKLYNKSFIKISTSIYSFYDSSGRLVITDNPRLKAINSSN